MSSGPQLLLAFNLRISFPTSMGAVDTYAGEIFSSDNLREVWKMRQVF